MEAGNSPTILRYRNLVLRQAVQRQGFLWQSKVLA
jgi:hypothetical protein